MRAMAVTKLEVKRIIDLHLEGKLNQEIADELDMHRNTVSNQLASNQDVIERKIRKYDERLEQIRADKLESLAVDDSDAVKAFTAVDQAIERRHKIRAGYYITSDKLKTEIIPAILATITRHVTDESTLQAIATDLAGIKEQLK
jgi:hypothetical protein